MKTDINKVLQNYDNHEIGSIKQLVSKKTQTLTVLYCHTHVLRKYSILMSDTSHYTSANEHGKTDQDSVYKSKLQSNYEGCKKLCNCNFYLKRHIRNDIGDRHFACDRTDCNQSFKRQNH